MLSLLLDIFSFTKSSKPPSSQKSLKGYKKSRRKTKANSKSVTKSAKATAYVAKQHARDRQLRKLFPKRQWEGNDPDVWEWPEYKDGIRRAASVHTGRLPFSDTFDKLFMPTPKTYRDAVKQWILVHGFIEAYTDVQQDLGTLSRWDMRQLLEQLNEQKALKNRIE